MVPQLGEPRSRRSARGGISIGMREPVRRDCLTAGFDGHWSYIVLLLLDSIGLEYRDSKADPSCLADLSPSPSFQEMTLASARTAAIPSLDISALHLTHLVPSAGLEMPLIE